MFGKVIRKYWMLSVSLKVKDFFNVSGKSGNPEQCTEVAGLHW